MFYWPFKMDFENIDKFFIDALLKIIIMGVFLILLSNVIPNPENKVAITISSIILLTCIICFPFRHKFPTYVVLLVTTLLLSISIYLRLTDPSSTYNFSILLITGFIFSVLLIGKLMWFMHSVAFIIISTVFLLGSQHPINDAITYTSLYFILSFVSGVIKYSYDKIHNDLNDANILLNDKAKEVEAQNEELRQIQENLFALNQNLEKMVTERTQEIQNQNKKLVQYGFNNAHHLRGPVTRLLGLASIYKLDENPNAKFYIDKMVDQAHEIDAVVKKINSDLIENNIE